MRTNKIAVLGSSSFAGSVFATCAAKEGCQVLGVSRSPSLGEFESRQLDLNHDLGQLFETLSCFKPDVVVDFAGQGMVAESWQSPEQWYQTNIVSKVKLHHWLKDQTWLQKYVRISTPEVYGSCTSLISEDKGYAPSTPYAVSHAAIDMSLKAFFHNYNFPVVIGRFANFYGEHQQLYRIIPKTILSILSGKKLPLHGGGTSVRAFIHADDVARGIFRMIDEGKTGEVYHFSPEYFYSIRDVVEKICEKLNAKFEDVVEMSPERQGKDQAYLMSAQKARKELGWLPKVLLDDGLARAVGWISNDFDTLSRMPWNYVHKA